MHRGLLPPRCDSAGRSWREVLAADIDAPGDARDQAFSRTDRGQSLFSLSGHSNDQKTNYFGVFSSHGGWLAKATSRQSDAVVFIEWPESSIDWTECIDIFVTDDGIFLGTEHERTKFDPRGMSAVSFSHIQVVPHNISDAELVSFFRSGFVSEQGERLAALEQSR